MTEGDLGQEGSKGRREIDAPEATTEIPGKRDKTATREAEETRAPVLGPPPTGNSASGEKAMARTAVNSR